MRKSKKLAAFGFAGTLVVSACSSGDTAERKATE